MATQSNIVTTKADGSTTITYVAMNPSSGDGKPAFWRANAEGTNAASHPSFWLSCRPSGNGKARRTDWEFRYPEPYTNTTTGLVSIANTVIATGSFLLPLGSPDTLVIEPANQLWKLLYAAQTIDTFKSGYAPT